MRLECPYMWHPQLPLEILDLDLMKSEPLCSIIDVCAPTSLDDFGCNCPTRVSCLNTASVHLQLSACLLVFHTNEFKHVEVIDDFANDKHKDDPRVEYMYFDLQFEGHFTRAQIRAHLAESSGVSVAACTCSAVPKEVKQEMIRANQEL
jgi:hypothetical protein